MSQSRTVENAVSPILLPTRIFLINYLGYDPWLTLSNPKINNITGLMGNIRSNASRQVQVRKN